MSNGDSLDGFVFPPFIPTSSTRPAPTPAAAAPQPSAPESAPEPAEAAGGRMVMPWDLETPIVREDDAVRAPAAPQPDTASGDDKEDLPWLEVPAPRDEESAAAPSAPAADEAFPDWMAWDQRDETAATADVRDTVEPIAGLEDFVPLDDLGGRAAPAPAAEWADSEPAAQAQPSFDAARSTEFQAEPFPELVFDDAPAASEAAAPATDDWSLGTPEAAAPPSDDWSLSTPEAAAPPPVTEAPLPSWEESPAAAEPSFEISVNDADSSVIDIAAAEPPAFAGDEEPAGSEAPSFLADEPAVAEPPLLADAPGASPEPQPFVADAEAVIAAEPEPVVADEPAAEPASFTAAAPVAEIEAGAPAESAATAGSASPFDDVAERLEGIARMLRERPDELLAGGSSDPLALLVTGYVMGYTARGGR